MIAEDVAAYRASFPGGWTPSARRWCGRFQQRLDEYRAMRDADFLPASRANDPTVAAVEPKLQDRGLRRERA